MPRLSEMYTLVVFFYGIALGAYVVWMRTRIRNRYRHRHMIDIEALAVKHGGIIYNGGEFDEHYMMTKEELLRFAEAYHQEKIYKEKHDIDIN